MIAARIAGPPVHAWGLRGQARCAPKPPILLALAALALAACSGAPAPAARPTQRATELSPPAPPPAPIAPARWVDSSGATWIGPAVDGGTLVLAGGRRAFIAADGSVRGEAAASPEALLALVEIPPAGGGRRQLVGHGRHGVYRFDEPLGAPAPLASTKGDLRGLGAAPGLVAIWEVGSDLPRFVDVETGQLRDMPGLPPPPLAAIAFHDEKNGAAIFEAAGLAVTSDGGVSWRLAGESVPGDALRVRGLRLRGDAIHAYIHADGRDAPIDVAQARLGPMVDPAPPPATEPPMLRWLRVTGRDPLEAAIANGLPAGPGMAMAASHGLVARIDLATGAVRETSAFASGSGVNACGVGGTERAAWIACALSEDSSKDLYDPFGVMRVSLVAGRLVADRPSLTRNGEAELRTSPSGGAMLLASCNADEDGVACARQPSGRWATIVADIDLYDRGAGPLADGRIALIRGLYDGDAPPEDEEAEEAGGEREGAPPRGPHVAVIGLDGKERPVAPMGLPRPMQAGGAGDEGMDLRVVSPIEEAEDHALSFVMARGDEVWAVVHVPGREGASLARLAGASHARIHQGFGVAIGEGQLLASTDAGLGWSAVDAPPRVLEAIGGVDLFDEPGVLAVGALGMKLDTQLRIGWGAALEEPAPSIPKGGGLALPPRASPPPAGPDLVLACATQGPAQSTPPLLGSNQVVALLTRGVPSAPKGTERKVTPASAGRWGMLDAIGVLEEQGPIPTSAGGLVLALRPPPATWTLRWLDPREIGAKPRSWTGRPPRGVGWGSSVRAVSAQGGRALFTLRAGGKHLLARVKSPGGIELAEVPWELLPGTEVVFGTERGEPIAWLHDTALVVWVSGEPPRIVASIATHASRVLGQPTRDGVPVLLGAADWALWQTLPIPPAPKPSARRSAASAVSGAAAPIPLAGWAEAPNLRRELGRLPACGPKPKGARFLLHRLSGAAYIDGYREHIQAAVYDVRMASAEACVASVAALLSPERGGAAPQAAKGGPVTFARADFVGKRGEGGERGLDPQAPARRLGCGLVARP